MLRLAPSPSSNALPLTPAALPTHRGPPLHCPRSKTLHPRPASECGSWRPRRFVYWICKTSTLCALRGSGRQKRGHPWLMSCLPGRMRPHQSACVSWLPSTGAVGWMGLWLWGGKRVEQWRSMDAHYYCSATCSRATCLKTQQLADLPPACYRSDLTLVCSPVELSMLVSRYGVPASKLVLAPFFAPPSPYDPAASMEGRAGAAAAAAAAAAAGTSYTAAAAAAAPPFEQRKHFLMIGNWRHPPNLDSARWACNEVWPALRQALAPEHRDAELHLYGAYAAGAAQQLHKPVSRGKRGSDRALAAQHCLRKEVWAADTLP